MTYQINTQKVVDEYNKYPELQEEFESLYHYMLYLCGGDNTLFDNQDLFKESYLNTSLDNERFN